MNGYVDKELNDFIEVSDENEKEEKDKKEEK